MQWHYTSTVNSHYASWFNTSEQIHFSCHHICFWLLKTSTSRGRRPSTCGGVMWMLVSIRMIRFLSITAKLAGNCHYTTPVNSDLTCKWNDCFTMYFADLSLVWEPHCRRKGSRTNHLSTGHVEQIGRVIAGGQGLRLQGAGILQLLHRRELSLIEAWFCDGEAWMMKTENHRLLSATHHMVIKPEQNFRTLLWIKSSSNKNS